MKSSNSRKIYIDFFSAVSRDPQLKSQGGGNYARKIVKSLADYKGALVEIILLYPKWYEVNECSEPDFFNRHNIKWLQVEKIDRFFELDPGSILYYPILVYFRDLMEIKYIKKANQDVKVCATIHDLRALVYKADYTDKYYYNGTKKILFPLYDFFYERMIKRCIKRIATKRALLSLDEVYTVSNYSEQQILDIFDKVNIRWYYQSSIFEAIHSDTKQESNYVLFVSGVRRIKNLSHTLIGFSIFKRNKADDNTKLVVTGINKDTMNNLKKIPALKNSNIFKDIVLYDYVTNEKLSELYANCRYVLYLSKSEGFGLPVIEAGLYGKTCIASNIMSIPEVLGNAVRYVNPKDDKGIAKQIEYFSDEDNLMKYEARVKKSMEQVSLRMKNEEIMFLEDLLDGE